jgi:dipeptide transport system ATP-binding protein
LFNPRCGFATETCRTKPPALDTGKAGRVRCHYPLGNGVPA